jgi:voltage-gated potassium channel
LLEKAKKRAKPRQLLDNNRMTLARGTPAPDSLRQWLWRIIFLSDTRAGRLFDVVLLWMIGLSVLVVALESVQSIRAEYAPLLSGIEWVLTILFTVEFLLRLCVVRSRSRYLFSFFGIVDIIAIAPSWLELLLPDLHYLMAFRILRLMRMFRILKMAEYLEEAATLMVALKASRRKILVFFVSVLSIVCVEGTVLYVLENDTNPGYSSIPQSIYWAIVTLTTVGYGDVAPVTAMGKMMASVIMLTGFAIIAVPTGIVSTALMNEGKSLSCDDRTCLECGLHGHPALALYCHRCGVALPSASSAPSGSPDSRS